MTNVSCIKKFQFRVPFIDKHSLYWLIPILIPTSVTVMVPIFAKMLAVPGAE